MANSVSNLSLDLLTATACEYLRTKSALIDRVYTTHRQSQNLSDGVKSVKVRMPGAELAPSDFGTNAAISIAVPTVTVNFNQHKEVYFSMSELESRTIAGNFRQAFLDTVAGGLDGLVKLIDKSLTALVPTLAVNAPVGTAGTLTTDQNVRDALLALNKKNVDAETCSLVVSPTNWWDGLLNETKYTNVLNYGNALPIQNGVIPSLYGLRDVARSNNINFVAGAPGHAENVILNKYAFVLGFLEFEPANTYGAANVEESIFSDPESGIALRIQRWYSPLGANAGWNARIDVCWGVSVLDDQRAIRVLGQ
jgi:hypothetical protein